MNLPRVRITMKGSYEGELGYLKEREEDRQPHNLRNWVRLDCNPHGHTWFSDDEIEVLTQ